MILAYAERHFEASLTGAPTGLVGTLTFSVINPETEAVVIAERTTGIFEVVDGTYWTHDLAPATPDQYHVVWSDGDTNAVEEMEVLLADAERPSVADVSLLLRTRTVGPSSGGLGGDTAPGDLTIFTDSTRPTAVEVEALIGTSHGAVTAMLRKPIPDTEIDSIRHAVALYAAILIETSFFRENSNAEALAALRAMLRDAVAGINEMVVLTEGRSFGTLTIGTTLTGSRRLSEDIVSGLDT
jgi:hypothetical protein